ncbi:MAG: hypothetical protein ACLQOO_15285 [Terriglobia bacterium]
MVKHEAMSKRRNAQKFSGAKTKAGKRRVAPSVAPPRRAFPEIERKLQARGEDPRDFRCLHRDVATLFHPQDVTRRCWDRGRDRLPTCAARSSDGCSPSARRRPPARTHDR